MGRIRSQLEDVYASNQNSSVKWLSSHAIQLRAGGELKAHVDSVRFSGDLVAGLSLRSSSIMRLRPAASDAGDENDGTNQAIDSMAGHVDLLLRPRSLYALYGPSRYLYTHELLPDQAVFRPTSSLIAREDRFSVIFRDAKDN